MRQGKEEGWLKIAGAVGWIVADVEARSKAHSSGMLVGSDLSRFAERMPKADSSRSRMKRCVRQQQQRRIMEMEATQLEDETEKTKHAREISRADSNHPWYTGAH
jgi:hypothetical protein